MAPLFHRAAIINRMQAAEITPGSDGLVESAAARHYLQRACSIPSLPGVMGVHSAFLSLITLTFDLDIQTRSSEDQTRLPCKFGANPFSHSRDIQTNKKRHSAKAEPYLRAVITGHIHFPIHAYTS